MQEDIFTFFLIMWSLVFVSSRFVLRLSRVAIISDRNIIGNSNCQLIVSITNFGIKNVF